MTSKPKNQRSRSKDLDEAERQIRERIEFENRVIEDQNWRIFYEEWRAAALEYLEAICVAGDAGQKFARLHEKPSGAWYQALRLERMPMVNPCGFGAAIGHIHAKEMGRRERMDAYVEQKRSEKA